MENQEEYQKHQEFNKTIISVVVCPRCKGEGTIKSLKSYGNTESWVPVNQTCPACYGRRNLRRTITMTYEKLS